MNACHENSVSWTNGLAFCKACKGIFHACYEVSCQTHYIRNSFDAMYYAFHIELWYTPKITWFAYTWAPLVSLPIFTRPDSLKSEWLPYI